jgi:hypothetical protein
MYEKVKTVKVNLKDIEKQKTPSKKESNQKQKWNSSSKNKYSPESNISKVNGLDSYQAYDNGDIIINRRREEDEAIRKILENPQHDKAFLEALMKRYDSGIKKVEIEITEAKEREIKELKSRNETLQQERDELYSENEKLRKTRDIINQELSQVREALVKARSECRMLEDTVSDMEELIKKQEDIHYMEMKKLEREMESKIALNVKQEKDLLISEKASGSPSEKKSEFIKNKKVFKNASEKTISSVINDYSTRDYREKDSENILHDPVNVSNEKFSHSQLLEEKLRVALQAQAITEEKLLKREKILKEMSEKNRQLQNQLQRYKPFNV